MCRGRVVDEAHRPIAGADVSLVTDGATGAIATPRGEPDERAPARRERTTTDALGTFRIAARLAGGERLRVRARGFVPLERSIPSAGGSAVELWDLELRAGLVLTGRVLDATRAPVAGARVRRLDADARPSEVLAESDSDASAVSAADGSFTIDDLAPGPWSLLVKAGDHPDKLVRGTVEAGGRVSDLEIVLADGLEIRGRVVGAPAEALQSLWVRAVPVPGPTSGVLFAGDRVDPDRFVVLPRGASCAADGSFVVRGLTAEMDYRLSAREGEHDFFGPVRTNQVAARAGALDVQLVYRAGTALTFQVVDGSTQQPITEFEVRMGRAHLQPLANDDGSARRSFPDGRVRVAQGLEGGGDAPFQLAVDARGYEIARVADVRLTPGRETDLGALRLAPSSLVTVRVVDAASDAPVAGARVSLAADRAEEQDSAASSAWHSAVTDAGGIARLNALVGDSVRLRVRHADFAPYRSASAGSFAGARDEVVRLRAGGTVVVEVRDALGAAVRGQRIRHATTTQEADPEDERDPDRSRTDAEGRLVYAHLAPGEHAFELDARRGAGAPAVPGTGAPDTGAPDTDPAARRVVVADGGTQTLNWVVPARARLSGRVTAEARPVSGATLLLAPRDPADLETLDARTNGNGEYVLNALELRTYAVTIVHPSRAMPFETEVTIAALQQTFDVELPPTSIEGRIVDAEGRALADVLVRVGRPDAGADGRRDESRSTGAVVRTRPDGSYVLHGVQAGVDLVVEAEHADFQPARSESVRVSSGERREGVDLVLAAGAVLEVSVARAGASCRVRATYDEGPGAAAPTAVATVAANGIARLSGLRPGRWRIQLEGCADPSRNSGAASPGQTVEVALDRANAVRFELP